MIEDLGAFFYGEKQRFLFRVPVLLARRESQPRRTRKYKIDGIDNDLFEW